MNIIRSIKDRFSRFPVRLKILGGSLITLLLISVFVFLYYPYIEKQRLYQVMDDKYHSTAEMIAFGVGAGVDSDNFEIILQALEWAKKDSNIILIVALDTKKEAYGMYNPLNLLEVEHYLSIKDSVVDIKKRALHIVKVPIVYNNTDYGTISVVTSLDNYHSTINKSTNTSFYISLALFLFGISITYLFIKSILKPLSDLQSGATKMAEGNYDINIQTKSKDEISALASSFNKMASIVKNLVKKLNIELETVKAAEKALKESEEN